jgi:hypothetical protein
MTGTYLLATTVQTWVANNSAPATRRATSLAITFSLYVCQYPHVRYECMAYSNDLCCSSNFGGILTTWLLGSLSPAPDYVSAMKTFIIMYVLSAVFYLANLGYLRRENRRKALVRQQMSKEDEPNGLGDKSAWFIYST